MEKATIAIGSDHAGFYLKEHCKHAVSWQFHTLNDVGTTSYESCDYPDFAHEVARLVDSGEVRYGVLFCGSANGVAITANKYPNVNAALCWNVEVANLARAHNNANILCIPAKFVTSTDAEKIIREFLHTTFEGGRHQRRINKIPIKTL